MKPRYNFLFIALLPRNSAGRRPTVNRNFHEIASPVRKSVLRSGPAGFFLVLSRRDSRLETRDAANALGARVCSESHNKLETRRSTWRGEMLTTAHAAKLIRRIGGWKGEGKEGRAFAKTDEEEEEKRKVRRGTTREDRRGEKKRRNA